jgi:UDP-glucuronate decarboxylase
MVDLIDMDAACALHGPQIGGAGLSKVVAVTGGAGFVGSHLCRRLLSQGHEVVCLDNLHTGRLENVEGLKATGRFTFVNHDVRQPLPNDLGRFDQIYNFACPASPSHYQSDPVKTVMTCVLGIHHVLERARRDGASVLQASTSEVYGDPMVHPQREDYLGNVNPVGPRACYDEGKRLAETLATDYRLQHGVDVKIVRIFNTYGPRMSPEDGRVMSNFITQALRGEDITIFGDGRQTRSFCFVDDLVEGCLRLMNRTGSNPGPVNIGNPAEMRVCELAQLVLRLTRSTAVIDFRPLPIDDPRRRRPDISRAKALLDWEPRVSLNDGVARTIAYFEQELAAAATPLARHRRAEAPGIPEWVARDLPVASL